jgi:hypothetical protein
MGKIVRAKSKFKADPEQLGIGGVMPPIFATLQIDAAALSPSPRTIADPS